MRGIVAKKEVDPAAFERLCTVIGLDMRKWKESKARFEQLAKSFGQRGAVNQDFTAVVAMMDQVIIQEHRFLSPCVLEATSVSHRADADLGGGLVGSSHTLTFWPETASHGRLFPHFTLDEDVEPFRRASYVHYVRTPSSGQVGHCEPIFPATNYYEASINHPTMAVEPTVWTPVLYRSNPSFFLTPYHQVREFDPDQLTSSNSLHVRTGMVVRLKEKEGTNVGSKDWPPYLTRIGLRKFEPARCGLRTEDALTGDE
jgi:hypothetical protein